MKNLLQLLFIVCFLNIWSLTCFAQIPQDTLLWQIETIDGNSFIGKLTQQDNEKIILETEIFGTMTILKTAIKSMNQIKPEELVEGEFYFRNPHASRYFFGTNGYGLKKGEGYYENTWILFNQLTYGFHDNITMGVGMIPLFLFAGAPTPVWIIPKVQFPVIEDKINLGAGALLATVLSEDMSFGIIFGVATFGSRDNNVTVGLGYGFSNEGWADLPTISFSGTTRVSAKTYLMTENYYINLSGDNIGIISFGGRSVQKRLAISYGLIIPVADIGSIVAIPWLGIAVPFGGNTTARPQQIPLSHLY